MKKMCLGLLAAAAAFCLAAAESFTIAPVDRMPVYKCGEKAQFSISALKDGKAITAGQYTAVFTLDGNKKLGSQVVDFSKGNPATVSTTLDKPGFVLVRLEDAKGRLVSSLNAKGRKVAALAGAGFEPEKIRMGDDLPQDFMAFWEAGRKQLAKKQLKLEKLEKRSTKEFTLYYVTMETLNNETLTGYLAIPNGKGPFPAYITVPGAGPGIVGASAWARQGVITLSMNVHKFPTASTPAEQRKRYDADRKGSYYPHRGLEKRETYFFYSVYTGIDRAINYVASLPEWDKKHMVVDGSSQGGGSALILAGLNKNITALAANVPALCDHGGAKTGRSSGWPRLDRKAQAASIAPYFDAANFARFINVPALVSAGFIDVTCSPASVYAAYNQLKGPKEMHNMPREGHTVTKEYSKMRDAFISKHLGLTK